MAELDHVVDRIEMPSNARTRILWVAPRLNHYRVAAFRQLHKSEALELSVFAGTIDPSVEDIEFHLTVCGVRRRRFGMSAFALIQLTQSILRNTPDLVLMPIEKKLILPILWLLALRSILGFKLASYNHACLRSSQDRIASRGDIQLSRVLFRLFDRVIFYSAEARDYALSNHLVRRSRAFYANNSVDTRAISRYASFDGTLSAPIKILFVGRLAPTKKLSRLFDYFSDLEEVLNEVELHIVGDGVESGLVESQASTRPNVYWHGMVTREKELAKFFNACHLVFIPGSAGLAIPHAFAYGKPFVTIDGTLFKHGPEFAFLINNRNGLILSGTNPTTDTKRLVELLADPERYRRMCLSARATSRDLSIEQWAFQMENALAR